MESHSDIVDRLQRKANHFSDRRDAPELYRLLKEAADEIEALRGRIALRREKA